MALAPVLVTIVTIVLAIIILCKMAAFARSEIDRMLNLEMHSNEYVRAILPVIHYKCTPKAIITVIKEVSDLIGNPAAARIIHNILTHRTIMPDNNYRKIYEEFRASHEEVATKLREALHAGRIAWTYSNRKIGPETRVLLEKRELQIEQKQGMETKQKNGTRELPASADVLEFMEGVSRLAH